MEKSEMKTGGIVLTLDEAIKHCKENVQKETQNGNLQCAIEHNQLAVWLSQLEESKAKAAAYDKLMSGEGVTKKEVACLEQGYVKWLQQRIVELELSVMNLEEENARLKAQITWRPVSELPEKDQIVIATYRNGYGKRRRVSAVYVRQYEEEAGDDDELCVEYCEEQDEWYLKEGWYELIDNWDYSLVAIVEGVVDYWMPMPPAPEGERR